MSIIIAAKVKEGIVVGSDTRTTVKNNNGNIMYKDDAIKIVPFPNRIVVAHCGDASLTKKITVNEFLYTCRDKFGKTSRIFDLPMRLMFEFKKAAVDANITFFVAGYDFVGIGSCIYRIDTKNGTIELPFCDKTYGAVYAGCTDITNAIMRNIDYNFLAFDACQDIIYSSIETTIKSFLYQNPQSVGGRPKLYLISADGKQTGWLNNGQIDIDINAPVDAYDQWMYNNTQKRAIFLMNQQLKHDKINTNNMG